MKIVCFLRFELKNCMMEIKVQRKTTWSFPWVNCYENCFHFAFQVSDLKNWMMDSFLPSVPWLSRDISGRDGTGWQNPVPACPVAKYQNPVPSHVPARILTGCPGPSHPVTRFWACPVVPLSRDKEVTSVPLSRKITLSRPVGNPRTLFHCVVTPICLDYRARNRPQLPHLNETAERLSTQ